MSHNQRNNNQLQEYMKKKILSMAVVSLEAMEERFGTLWGHNNDSITEEEEQWDAAWDEVRNNIFDQAHKLIHLSENEMSKYLISYKGHRTNFIVRKESNDQ